MSEAEVRQTMAALVTSLHRDPVGEHRFGDAAIEHAKAAAQSMDRDSRTALARGLLALLDEMVARSPSTSVAALQLCTLARILVDQGADLDAIAEANPRAAALLGHSGEWTRPVSAQEPSEGSFGVLGLRVHVNKSS
jgi:hypothetical protein